MPFNREQENIINQGVQFLRRGTKQVFEYDGLAGTGKSYTLIEILRRAGFQQNEILPMAYTGSAAIVMRTKGFRHATTLHSGLFQLDRATKYDKDNHNVLVNTYFNAPESEDVFVVKDYIDPSIKVIVIDEGYMVPLEMRPFIEKFGLPIIVTGDAGQLPPINSTPAFLNHDNILHLTEIMRQSENDGIVYIANRARVGLPIDTGVYGNVLVIEEQDLSNDMIMASNIVLCGTNKRREDMNTYIRRDLFGIRDTLPVYGDRMICRKNNWNVEIDGIALANGLVGTVSEPINMLTYDGKTFQMCFQPDLLNRGFTNLTCDYRYLISDVNTRKMLKKSKYSLGEKFEFAYTSTTHLSQGSEYSGGIYIEEYLGPDIQRNLNYVGITRFRDWMIYVKHNRRFF